MSTKLTNGRELDNEILWLKKLIEISYDEAMINEGSIQDLFIKQAKKLEDELKAIMPVSKSRSSKESNKGAKAQRRLRSKKKK